MNPTLNEIINRRGGEFWRAMAISCQTHLFTGLYALVEQSNKVVSLATITNRMRKDVPAKVPPEIEEILKGVRTRYEEFRHVLFGHNGKDREVLVGRFDEYGFSWALIQEDLASLEPVFKCLRRLAVGMPVPSRDDSKQMRAPMLRSLSAR